MYTSHARVLEAINRGRNHLWAAFARLLGIYCVYFFGASTAYVFRKNRMAWPAIIIIVFLGAFSIGSTFFPVQSFRFLYMLVEWLCVLSGDDDDQEMLEIKYEGLKRDPKAYAERHWGFFIYVRLIGIVSLIIFISLIKDILIH